MAVNFMAVVVFVVVVVVIFDKTLQKNMFLRQNWFVTFQ